MHTKIFSATTIGVDAHLVEVEVDLSFGMINFFIVGLPDAAIKESRQRIQTALKNSGIKLPEKKITVNLAPADLKKEGTLFDLPIAIGILQAAQIITISKEFLETTLFLGELSLDGSIKSIKGALAIAYDTQYLKKKRIILSKENAQEASFIKNLEVIGVENLIELISFLRKEKIIIPTTPFLTEEKESEATEDFNQVKGQEHAKRALLIAAAGNHNILFIGSPGSGKTMLAKRLNTIMPPMSFEEILETSKIYSISGKLHGRPLIQKRQFRAPHHTISQAGLVGGGSFPQPGEISLAHHGILFLDELTEFKRHTLETLRQPLENKEIHISRAQQSLSFPASFLLIAALNPCPCGFYGDKKKACSCSKQQINSYLDKLSGPLLDRIDLQIHIPTVNFETIYSKEKTTSSQEMKDQVLTVASIQKKRFGSTIKKNALMSSDEIDVFCVLTQEAQELMKKIFNQLHLSMRGYHKTLKIARTIADLAEKEIIETKHLQEALFYRSLDQYFERKNNTY